MPLHERGVMSRGKSLATYASRHWLVCAHGHVFVLSVGSFYLELSFIAYSANEVTSESDRGFTIRL